MTSRKDFTRREFLAATATATAGLSAGALVPGAVAQAAPQGGERPAVVAQVLQVADKGMRF